ncbi:hypothetical protein GWK47_015664 [Chionoecetes opilio]|uniref:Uncharacterized protein n=1 Tax=Chionoecetes opilio TaxID=41210 RepID=A0A8J4XYU5_CHIOP|nr:hypothetical protein GWK47_015664 [Chionoecetes opilio]
MSGLRMRWEAFLRWEVASHFREVVLECKGEVTWQWSQVVSTAPWRISSEQGKPRRRRCSRSRTCGGMDGSWGSGWYAVAAAYQEAEGDDRATVASCCWRDKAYEADFILSRVWERLGRTAVGRAAADFAALVSCFVATKAYMAGNPIEGDFTATCSQSLGQKKSGGKEVNVILWLCVFEGLDRGF